MRWQSWYTMIVLSFFGWIFMYADRTVLSPILPLIGKEWSLTQSQQGLISSVFFLAYAALQIPTGRLSDRLNRRLPILVPGFILFGLATAAIGIAPSYLWLLVFSSIAGLGEGTYYPTQFALATEVIPPRHRSLGAAVINSGQAVGVSLGFLVSSIVGVQMGVGWRVPFLLLALPTVLVGLGFLVYIREPGRSQSATQKESADNTARWSLPRGLLPVCILNFFSLYGFFVILTWLPSYLQSARGYSGASVGFVSSLVPWMAIPGGLLWSYLSDRLGRRKPFVYLLVPIAAVALAAIPFLESRTMLIIALVVYGLVGKLALDPLLAALVADLAPRAQYGTVFGLFNFAGMASSIVAPYLTGFLADRTGSLNVGFYVAAAMLMLQVFALSFVREAGSRMQSAAAPQGTRPTAETR